MPFAPRLVLKMAAFPDAPAFIIAAAEDAVDVVKYLGQKGMDVDASDVETDNWGEPLKIIVLKDAYIRGAEYVLRAIAVGRH